MKLRINAICQMSWKLGCPSIGKGLAGIVLYTSEYAPAAKFYDVSG